MADIVECPTCGGKVSTEAATCPHCGQPDPSGSGSSGWPRTQITKYSAILIIAVAALLLVIGRSWYRHDIQSAPTSSPTSGQFIAHRPAAIRKTSNWLPEAGTIVIVRKNALICPSKRVLQDADRAVEKASAVDAMKRVRRAIRLSIKKGCRRMTDARQGQVTGSSNLPEPMFRVRLSDGKAFWIDRAYLKRPEDAS